MSETNRTVESKQRSLDESFGQLSNRTNTDPCANQDADLMEDGVQDDICDRP